MKRVVCLLILLLLCVGAAAAQEAENLTGSCAFKLCDTHFKSSMMTDGKYTSHWRQPEKGRHGWIAASAPEDKDIHSVYVCFAHVPTEWELQGRRDGEWETLYRDETGYAHVYIPLAQGEREVRLYITGDERQQLDINEIFLFGEGEKPDWVQVWQPTVEKADILFLSAHPDDELIFFAGGIPTYNTELHKNVVVAYLTFSNTTRRSELLNGLWSMGVTNYPVIGDFPDKKYNNHVQKMYRYMGGQSKVQAWVTELYRRYRPEVVVTHDIDGEYGHDEHRVAAQTAMDCFTLAADPEKFAGSAQEYGTWQVKKLYLHLWPENQIRMNWSEPLDSLGGVTGLEAAERAYAFHVTQMGSGMSVTETGAEYDNTLFGLAMSTVGADSEGGDFLENIPE